MERQVELIYFPDEESEDIVAVIQEGNGIYRLLEHPYLSKSAKYGDLIRCKEMKDERFESNEEFDYLEFIEVIEPSNLELIFGIFPLELLDSKPVQAVFARVMDNCGFWQRDEGGILSLLFNPEMYDPREDLERAFRHYKDGE